MLETIKEISKKCDPVFVGGVASFFNGYRKSLNDVKDIDIVLPIIRGLEDVSISDVSTLFDKGNKRGKTYINDYYIDIFITRIRQSYINEIVIDGVTIKYINKKGQKKYYSQIIRNTKGYIRTKLLDKYKGELNYI